MQLLAGLGVLCFFGWVIYMFATTWTHHEGGQGGGGKRD